MRAKVANDQSVLRWGAVVLAGALAAAGLGTAPARGAETYPGSRDRTLGPLISGSTSYVDGTYVWTDYAYDDRGPNGDAFSGGDSTYPASAAPGNAADLIQVQLGRTPEKQLRITAILETLVHPGLAAVGIGIDTDANRLTGAPSVPGNSWNTRTPLGLEAMVVLQGTTARLLKWERDAWRRVGELKATTDVASNSLEALVPDNVLAVPAEGSWRVVAAAGLGGADNSWVDGKGPIYD